jgi:predicted regulator of Ras-like GTPase activity (Roadblock/LC7/MglB family)
VINLKNEPSFHTTDSERIKQVLNEMKTIGKLRGILFANRNGDLIAENIKNDFDGNTFAAMCASVLESAEDLRKNLSSKKLKKIIVELESGQIIIMIECNSTTFLSFILAKESNIDPILNKIEEYCMNILKNY